MLILVRNSIAANGHLHGVLSRNNADEGTEQQQTRQFHHKHDCWGRGRTWGWTAESVAACANTT